MIKANVIIDYSKWKNKIKNPDNYLNKKIKKLSKIPYFKRKRQEFSILLTNNKKMKNLNLKFRKKNKPTDVLSFQSHEKFYIGDIAISYEIVNKRSKNSLFDHELDKMWIHGYLHLSGHDHIKYKDFKKMSKKENLIFNQINF